MTLDWQTDDDDVAALAAIRVLALRIEILATTKYVTDRTNFGDILQKLTTCTHSLKTLSLASACSVDQDCPGSWLCKSGTCEPPENPQEAATAARQRGKPRRGAKSAKKR